MKCHFNPKRKTTSFKNCKNERSRGQFRGEIVLWLYFSKPNQFHKIKTTECVCVPKLVDSVQEENFTQNFSSTQPTAGLLIEGVFARLAGACERDSLVYKTETAEGVFSAAH